jgi:hypothetical protein
MVIFTPDEERCQNNIRKTFLVVRCEEKREPEEMGKGDYRGIGKSLGRRKNRINLF